MSEQEAPADPLLAEWRALPEAAALEGYPELARELPGVWAASEFVARSCLREPALLPSLVESGELQRPLQAGEMAAALRDHLQGVADEAELGRRLRRFRRRQMVRIVWRDLARRAPLAETLEDLSELADLSIRQGLAHLHRWAVERWGTPRSAHGEPQELVVLAMGKLGARELNLSSDIDLVFAFPEHGETDGRRSLANEQFFTRLGRQLVNLLGQQTEEGFVFRVDMRLRPFGEAGPLVVSFDAMENYCQAQAREWERYAMIKARPVTGEAVYRERLLEILRPFVFRRYIDFGVIDAIREMKRRIQAEMYRRGMDANIKLGRGGIREIEFIGQALQLVHGGRDPSLQVRPILPVLARLGEKGLLPAEAVAELTAAYEFLRLTENRLQAWRDEQTHLLPADEAGQARLARTMGFDEWDAFHEALEDHRERVEHHFRLVFAEGGRAPSPLETVWQEGAGEEELHLLLGEAGFRNSGEALARLRDFRDSPQVRGLTAGAREKLDRLMPGLLQAAGRGAASEVTLGRLLRLLLAVVRRTAYLDLLLENPQVVEHLVRLAAESSWIVEQLVQRPVLLDELLDPRRLYSPLRREELARELSALLASLPADDLEQQMERLRQFAAGNRLRTAAADITGAIPLMVVSDHLTEIAEVVLDQVLELAWQQVTARHGRPGQVEGKGFAIVGYGKLGGIELGYGSDLDLVFLRADYPLSATTDGGRPVPNDVFYARLGQRIIHLLTTRMPSGILYEVDMRLRPNGDSGPLVSSLAGFEKYQLENAWTWEHQALVRARAVAGDEGVKARFDAVRRRVLVRSRDPEALRREVVEMREKMRAHLDRSDGDHFDLKQGRGGITDIEFMVQYAVLRWAASYPALTGWSDNIRLLETLAQEGLLAGEAAEGLILAYQRLRHAYHRCTLQERPALVAQEDLREERAVVERQWREWMLEP